MAAEVQTFKEVRDALDAIRLGKEEIDGKEYPRPTHLVNREIVSVVNQALRTRGDFFRAPSPMFFDRELRRVINMVHGDGDLRRMLRQLGLMPSERHTTLVEHSLIDRAAVAPERELHRISQMTDSAIYVNAGLGRMVKITADTIEEVPLGTDDVILLDPRIQDWPAFSELQAFIDEMRPQIGKSCTELLPDLPLTRHLTTRWSESSQITPKQAHQAYLTRFLFSFSTASRVPLWPALLFSGEQNSGKSTGLELVQLSVYGRVPEGVQFPSSVEDLQLSAATSSLLAYDNMDGANLDSPRNASMADTLCLISTGGRTQRRRLFTTATVDSYSLRTHLLMTSRAWPLDRDDFARRTLRFEIEPSRGHQLVGKDVIFPAVLAALPRMRAEILIRAQNIFRAYQQVSPAVASTSEMIEYEQYTYRCAAYEGTLDATQELWVAVRDQSKLTLTDTSPIVQAMRLFIGKRAGRVKRIGIAELFASLQTVAYETGQSLPFRAANRLGVHLRNSGPSLAAIGVIVDRDNRGGFVSIEPSTTEIERCVAMFGYLRHENLNRVAPYMATPHKPDENIVDEEANRSLETVFHDDISDLEAA